MNYVCPTCNGTSCIHSDDKMEDRRIAGQVDPCCPDCESGWVFPDDLIETVALGIFGPREGRAPPWKGIGEQNRAWYRKVARLALVAVQEWEKENT